MNARLAGEAPAVKEKRGVLSTGAAIPRASLHCYGCSVASGGTIETLRANFYEPAKVSPVEASLGAWVR